MDERFERADQALRNLVLAKRQLRAARQLYEAANNSRNTASVEWERAKENVKVATLELEDAIEELPDTLDLSPTDLWREHAGLGYVDTTQTAD